MMKTEPLEEVEAPPAFGLARDGEAGDSNRSISELISDLRVAFRSSDFDRVEEILIAREEKLKRELERKEEQYELSRESLGIERLERAEAEEELKSFKAKCVELENLRGNIDAMRERVTLADKRVKSAEERAKRSEERYERLLREVKKAEHERGCDLVELKKKNGELESEKRRAEEEVELWKRRFQELEEGASKAEGVKIVLAENGAMTSSHKRRTNVSNLVINEEEQFEDPLKEVRVYSLSQVGGSFDVTRKDKRKVQRTSPVWNYFDLVMRKKENGVIEERAICKVCKQDYIGKSSSGTSHLERHRKKCEAKHVIGGVDYRQQTL